MKFRHLIVALLLVASLQSRAFAQDGNLLKPGYPERYTVVKGDTLWDISTKFLQDAWLWPVLWQINDYIKNPHLIYPGDVLVLTTVNERPRLRVLRMQPQIRDKSLPQVHDKSLPPIPTIPSDVIAPFLRAPLVVDRNELDNAGYIVAGVDDNIILGDFQQFFARRLPDDNHKFYHVFRTGIDFVGPDTGEFLGLEAIDLGSARMLEFGKTARLEIVDANEEMSAKDLLLQGEEEVSLPHYFPHAPENDVRGRIIHTLGGVSEMGTYSIAVIALGEREGMEPGHVLRIRRHREPQKDPVTGKIEPLPEDDSGLMMVFRTFEKVSYALIMKSVRAIHVYDAVETP